MKKTMLMVLFAAVLGVAAPVLASAGAECCPLGCCSGNCCK